MPDSPMLELDSALQRAARLVLVKKQAVTTLLEWELGISRQEAGLLMQALEKAGIIGAPNSLGAQQVLVNSEAELEQLLAAPHAARKSPVAVSAAADDFSVRDFLTADFQPAATEKARQSRPVETRQPAVFVVPPTRDPLYREAVQLVVTARKASPTLLRQQLHVGDPRARRILAQLEQAQVVSAATTTGLRQVLMPPTALADYLSQLLAIAAAEASPFLPEVESPVASSFPASGPAASPTPEPPVPASSVPPAHSKPATTQITRKPAAVRPVATEQKPATRTGFALLSLGLLLVMGILWGGYRTVKSLFSSSPATVPVAVTSGQAPTTASVATAESVSQTKPVPIAEDIASSHLLNEDSAEQVVAALQAAQQDSAAANPQPSSAPDRAQVVAAHRPESKPAAVVAAGAAAPKSSTVTTTEPLQLSPVVAAAPEPGDSPATRQVRQVLAALYADLQAPPFAAEVHFAPQVRRYKNLTNTTPDAIQAYLREGHFTEYRDAVLQVEPGSLRVSEPASDGSRQLNYVEVSRAYLVNLHRYQRTRSSVRGMLDASFHLTLLKPERLLDETLE